MIFLSASIPSPERNPKYYESADIVAIRDCVRALATVVIPKSHLVWGGHPAITPLIRYVITTMGVDVSSHVTLYQSEWFAKHFPDENKTFEKVVITPEQEDRSSSLQTMRLAMMNHGNFAAGVFIGGMEGVEEEFDLFREKHPRALILAVSSTGAAARIVAERLPEPVNPRLVKGYAYMSLFRDLLLPRIAGS